MNKPRIRDHAIAALTGGIIGVFAYTFYFSFMDLVNFSFMEVYSFRLPLLSASSEERDRISKRADELISQGSRLVYQRAFFEHGLDGFGVGAGLGILVLLSAYEFRKYREKRSSRGTESSSHSL